jgi:hypothetical protein
VPAKIFPHETCQHINQPSTPSTKYHLLRTTWISEWVPSGYD